MDKKCLMCGSTRLAKCNNLIERGSFCDGSPKFHAVSYIWLDCGHVELFAEEQLVNSLRLNEDEEIFINNAISQFDRDIEQRKKNIESYTRQSEILKEEIKNLELKFKDENITVKEHNFVKEELTNKKRELNLTLKNILTNEDFIKNYSLEKESAIERARREFRLIHS